MSVIDALIEQMAPPEEVIRVVIGDQNLSFRAIADRSELRRIQRAAKRFSTIHSDNVILAEDRAFYDTDSETKALAFVLAETSLDPKLKLNYHHQMYKHINCQNQVPKLHHHCDLP